ncbi:MAG: hypothetical protein O3A87_08365 [Verrucomicrobia bacterium]|nr:hypothetical protein [Verrucomicrobiota bacterium]MDA1006476.1 hypothetical protein [Verrucomicrobiota bacterium]
MKKLNLGTTLAALCLFFLPWLDFQCSGKSMMTQSGLQVISGGGTPSAEFEDLAGSSGKSKMDEEERRMSPIVGIVFLDLLLAFVLSIAALRVADHRWSSVVQGLCAGALLLLALQMAIGFPAAEAMQESLHRGGGREANPESALVAAMLDLKVKRLPSLYLLLAVLVIPTLMFVNGLIDRFMKKGGNR